MCNRLSKVTNGKEVLHRCLADALRVKKVQEVELGMDDQNMTAMSHIDDEATLLYVYYICIHILQKKYEYDL